MSAEQAAERLRRYAEGALTPPVSGPDVHQLATDTLAVLAERDLLRQQLREAQDDAESNAFAAKQFDIMRREKEHGWDEAERMETERDALAAMVKRVRALCEDVERTGAPADWSVSTKRLRAALDGEEASDAP